jgi:hypothetical protein
MFTFFQALVSFHFMQPGLSVERPVICICLVTPFLLSLLAMYARTFTSKRIHLIFVQPAFSTNDQDETVNISRGPYVVEEKHDCQ